MTPEEIVKQRILKELEHMLVDQIKLAILNEREACAKIAEKYFKAAPDKSMQKCALHNLIQDIQARGEK